ncbi:MAG: DUF1194 domain-containing protein, partial [Alphaproteobacteria bacterium]|nr:DUF1194 domain-containing protein [Alphaproteobacteria bacterium]
MARHSLNFLLVCLVVAMVAAAGPARAQTTSPTVTEDPKALIDVDLQLVLAVDVSASIDAEEGRLQRDGYVKALLDPLVS